MKQKFSTSWISSKQVRKQRKYRYNAPLHLRHRFLSANLSKELRERHGKRSITVRTGDEVLIMRGKFAKKKGKVLSVGLKKGKVTVEGMNRGKLDGTKVNVFFDASNLQIVNLQTDDVKRMRRMKKSEIKTERKEVKKETKIEIKETKETGK